MGGLVSHSTMKNLLVGDLTQLSTKSEVIKHMHTVVSKLDAMLRHYSIPVTNAVPRDVGRSKELFKEGRFVEGLFKICEFINLSEKHTTMDYLLVYDLTVIRDALELHLPVMETVGV